MTKILSSLIAIVAIGTGFMVTHYLTQIPELPPLDLQKWWGQGPKPREEDKSIRPFKVDFNDTMINDLKQRIRNRRPFTKPLEGIQSEYGINANFLNSVLDYWVDKYDFKRRVELMNRFPRFKTRIQGLDIQYIRIKPSEVKNVQVLPLLMLHGWPTSSKEFDKVIPMLLKPNSHSSFTFEIIAPDLPGHGFSEGTNKPGLGPLHIGILMRNLMRRLGFDQFYIQAGDWGSVAATDICTVFPDEVLGFHTNLPLSLRPISIFKMLIGSIFPNFITESHLKARIYPLSNILKFMSREMGYFIMFSTKPDTVGVALTDSPAALAGWIIEKMAIGSDRNQLHTPHGGIDQLQLEDVLDVITVMWANNSPVTAGRTYAEAIATLNSELVIYSIPSQVPTAVVNFLHEIIYQPDWILRDKFPNLVRSQAYEFGGHFAGLQTPQVLADEILASTVEFLRFHENKKFNN